MEQSLSMEEALEPQGPQQGRRNNYFVAAIAASLVLHAACSVILLGLPSGSDSPQSVSYLDLSSVQIPAAAPMAAPAPKPEPQAAPVPEQPAEPEKAEIPEPVAQVEQPESAPVQPAAAPQELRGDEHLPQSTLGLGLTRGFFKSFSDGETLRVGVKEYFLDMLQVINEKWWLDQEVQKEAVRPIMIRLTIARNGAIVASTILRSSGNIRYDKAVLAALNSASPLPPLPPSYHGEFFEVPIRLVPPLNLMSWNSR